MEAVSVPLDDRTLDLKEAVEYYRNADARLQVSTAPGHDGIIRRIEVQARDPNVASNWAVFALANTGNQQIDRLLVTPHYYLPGSGLFWPDLGSMRIVNITPSEGFAPERISSKEADVFLITLDPGAVVTFIVELQGDQLPQIKLWNPDEYRNSINNYTLYRGIIIGISALLAVFLTIIFVVKGTAMFPAAAGLAWSVLVYICIDFGFWNEIFNLEAGQNQLHRAIAEILLASSLIVFIYTYLNLNRWHSTYRLIIMGALLLMALIFAVAMIEPNLAAGVARISFALTTIGGLGLIGYLSWLGYDRAIMLIPTWILLFFWLIAAYITVIDVLDNEIVHPAMAGGMVLIILLIGFTLMQHAFTGGTVITGEMGDQQRRALAFTGAGDMVWDWDVIRDHITIAFEIEKKLGLRRGTLESPARDWLDYIHQADQDRFRITLDTVLLERHGRIILEFRLRAASEDYYWFLLKARPVIGSDGEVIRCVGTIVDITGRKISEERLLHDAVHDNLTGLPNRELFMDRLHMALNRSKAEDTVYPSIILIDIDQFNDINENMGLAVGDSVLLAISRRLSRMIQIQDTLARIDGDQFAALIISEEDITEVENLARAMLRTLKSALPFGKQEVFLSASIGISHYEENIPDAESLYQQAQIALYDAKQSENEKISVFSEQSKSTVNRQNDIISRLHQALDRQDVLMHFQPILRLEDRSIVGFEALMRWQHPELGILTASEFMPLAEKANLAPELNLFALEKTAQQLAEWQQSPKIRTPIFISFGLSNHQLFHQDLVSDIKAVFLRSPLLPGSLKLQISEALIMDNPEFAVQLLNRLREMGLGLILTDFGTGLSSLPYLHRLPFDAVKITRSFVHNAGQSDQLIILRSIIGLAHDLDMEVIAEGAEDENDVQDLIDHQCEFAQGFLFGQPMPAAKISEILLRNSAYTLS